MAHPTLSYKNQQHNFIGLDANNLTDTFSMFAICLKPAMSQETTFSIIPDFSNQPPTDLQETKKKFSRKLIHASLMNNNLQIPAGTCCS